jgi:thioredoxin 1
VVHETEEQKEEMIGMANNMVELTDANFSSTVENSTVPVMVDFWAPWCGPCKLISPIVEEMAGEFDGKLRVGKVNIDENPGVASQFNIRAIPTLLFFRNGEVVDILRAAVPKDQLQEKIEKVLAG